MLCFLNFKENVMYKVGQLFMFNVDGIRAIWALVDVNLEKDEYTIECIENCALKGMRKTGSKTQFDKTVITELPRIIPEDEIETNKPQEKTTHIQLSGRRHPASEKTSINDPAKVKTFKLKRGRLSPLFNEIDAHEDMFAKPKKQNDTQIQHCEEDVLGE